jgi:hypothetical protein
MAAMKEYEKEKEIILMKYQHRESDIDNESENGGEENNHERKRKAATRGNEKRLKASMWQLKLKSEMAEGMAIISKENRKAAKSESGENKGVAKWLAESGEENIRRKSMKENKLMKS